VRSYDAERFAALGLLTVWPQHGEAYNSAAGTLRGLHFQLPPHGETKVIRCVRGAVYDVLLDARPDSPTYGRWEGFHLRDDDELALYAPAGLAHGYQTLCDETMLHYLHSAPYVPDAAAGYRYDSPQLAIPWPRPVSAISERDRALPAFGSGVDA